MSYFFAFEVPDKARAEIAAFAERWQSRVSPELNAKWVTPENYHITLKYLGSMSPELTASTVQEAETTVKRMSSWRRENGKETEGAVIEQKPSVLFPAGKPPVLWIEITPTELLNSFAYSFLLFPNLNWDEREHRRYKPHITLAYCKPEAEVGPMTLTEQAFEPFTVSRFVLLETLPPEKRANGGKARYNAVHTFPFGNGQISEVS